MYTRLKRLIKTNRWSFRFDLSKFKVKGVCGTYGCLVGNDYLAAGVETRRFSYEDVARYYGITLREAFFLFSPDQIASCLAARNGKTPFRTEMRQGQRQCRDKWDAIRRVEKYVAWKESYEDRLVETLRVQRLDREARRGRTRRRGRKERVVCLET